MGTMTKTGSNHILIIIGCIIFNLIDENTVFYIFTKTCSVSITFFN